MANVKEIYDILGYKVNYLFSWKIAARGFKKPRAAHMITSYFFQDYSHDTKFVNSPQSFPRL